MFKIIFVLILAGIVSCIATLLSKYDSNVLIEISSYQVSISLLFLILSLIIILLVSNIAINFIVNLIKFPGNIITKLKNYSNKSAQEALTNVLIETANGNYKKAKSLLPKSSATPFLEQILSLQIAQGEGNDLEVEAILNDMLHNKENENLAYKGLISLYIKMNNFTKALDLANLALKNNLNTSWLLKSLHYIYLNLDNPEQSLFYYNKFIKLADLDKSEIENNRANLYFLIAKKLTKQSNYNLAIDFLKKSLNLGHFNFEAWESYIELLISLDNKSKALKAIEECWNYFQNNKLADYYLSLLTNIIDHEKITKLAQLHSTKSNNDNGWLVLTRTAIQYGLYEKASSYLDNIIEPCSEYDRLNAIINASTNNNMQKLIELSVI